MSDPYRIISPEEALLLVDRLGLAMAIINDNGYPTTSEEKAEIAQDAGEMAEESFTRRGRPTPPGGWGLALLDPGAHWRPFLRFDVARAVDEQLITRPPSAVVMVLFAVALP